MSDSSTELAGTTGPVLPAHLYVHVPFCASKCAYCDFASVAGADESTVDAVFAGIRGQLTEWSRSGIDGVPDTVYVGGGTPSFVAEQTARLLRFAGSLFVLHRAVEVTVEANPDSLTPEVALLLRDAGVTRVSIGVQSFDDRVLRLLGRRHDAASAVRAVRVAEEAGFDVSIDLMCGVPGQTEASWGESLSAVSALGVKHASVYPLSVEEGTQLSVAVDAGLVAQPDPDAAADMMLMAETALTHAGLLRYEVANYAVFGHESRHNDAYWSGRAYIGAGPGAHGMLDAETARAFGMLDSGDDAADVARVRYANAGDIERWLFGRERIDVELFSAGEAAREDVMLGMRRTRGVSADQVAAAGLTPVLESLAADGLVTLAGDGAGAARARWTTTQRGWLLGNEVFGRIWNAE